MIMAVSQLLTTMDKPIQLSWLQAQLSNPGMAAYYIAAEGWYYLRQRFTSVAERPIFRVSFPSAVFDALPPYAVVQYFIPPEVIHQFARTIARQQPGVIHLNDRAANTAMQLLDNINYKRVRDNLPPSNIHWVEG